MEYIEPLRIQLLTDGMSMEQITSALLAGRLFMVTRRGRHYPVSYRAPPCQRLGGKWWIPVWINGTATTIHQSQLHRFYVKLAE